MSPDWIAAYLHGSLSGVDRDTFETHLLHCRACRDDLAHASEVTSRAVPRVRWQLALAAAAVVATLWIGISPRSDRERTNPVIRSQAVEVRLQVVTPPDGAESHSASMPFTWRSVGADVQYTFILTDAEGDVLFRRDVPDTTLVIPASVPLTPAGEYFWVVDALLPGARTATTGFHRFIASP